MYKYIERGELWPLTNKALRFKGTRKRKYSPVRRASRAPSGKSIERRPEIVKLRETPGDWEMDSVEGKKGTPEALLVLTERATRNEIMVRMEQKTAANVVAALDALELEMGPQMFRRVFRSITVDNGSEFANWAGIERSVWKRKGQRTTVYFCHPYTACERGTNENINRMIRRHFPKGTDFGKVTAAEVKRVERWINTYPREILGFSSSADMFAEAFGRAS